MSDSIVHANIAGLSAHARVQESSLAVPGAGEVAAILMTPPAARWVYVMAHGAGAGMRHRFLEEMSYRLASRGIATLRYQFPYMHAGRKRPDPATTLEATVRAAIDAASALQLPIVAGGKSMGGRMTSQAMASAAHPAVRGLAFLGFPLHPAGKPASTRGQHLGAVAVPMLFLQGTRDTLADLTLLGPVCAALGGRATLHVVEGGDHSFAVLKKSGRQPDEVMDELASILASWGDALLGS